MDKKLAMKWVKALRSGKYEQGKSKLVENEKYCCLGVLCEIEGLQKSEDYIGGFLVQKFEGESEEYPGDSLKDSLGAIYDTCLAELNDSGIDVEEDGYSEKQSLTFDEIADIIQINYEDL